MALLARAFLGFADSAAAVRGAVVELPVAEAMSVAPPSPLWSALLAVLALAAAVGLAARALAGWILGLAACIAYLVTGIADIGTLRPMAPLADSGFWLFFVANLVVPSIVLAALVATRARYLPARAIARSHPVRLHVAARLPGRARRHLR